MTIGEPDATRSLIALLDRQKEALSNAKRFKGLTPSPSRRELVQKGTQATTIIGEMYPASRKPAEDLTPVSLRDLKLETQHQGRVLIVKTVCEASRVTGVQTVVVDETGAAERLGVYNFPATVAATEICPENAIFAIKEPYLKQSADGGVTIRGEIRAEKCYTAALQANTNGDAQLTHTLYRNRSGTRIRLGRFELARSDALLSVLQPEEADEGEVAQGNLKAYFRAGHALAEALRTERRLREEVSGSLNFATMHRELLDNQRLDHASFLRNTTVSECEHGRGLFAAADVKRGDVIFAEKAFCIALGNEVQKSGLITVIFNFNTSRVQMGSQASLMLALIDKVQHNPGQAEAYFDLFDGNRFGDKLITAIDERVVVDTFQVQGIAELNAFGAAKTDEEESMSGNTGIWLRASRANHSCLANAHRAFIGDFMIVRANVDIKAGEQVFLSYGTPLKSLAERRKFHDHYGFRCRCMLCQAESKRARLAREAVVFSKEDPRTLKSAAQPTSTALLKEATRLQQELDRTYDDNLFARLPRFDCSGWGIGANVSSRNAMPVLRDLGFFFDQHGKVLAYGLSEERAIHACVHAANAYEAMGQTGKARVLLALAKEVYTIDRGDLTGFEEKFGR
ncbi:TPR domain-containing protein [Geranomyces variabilis]|nr:TPR domain-containing protein [Geranomyces variabilis]